MLLFRNGLPLDILAKRKGGRVMKDWIHSFAVAFCFFGLILVLIVGLVWLGAIASRAGGWQFAVFLATLALSIISATFAEYVRHEKKLSLVAYTDMKTTCLRTEQQLKEEK
jgi:hypothetical protein